MRGGGDALLNGSECGLLRAVGSGSVVAELLDGESEGGAHGRLAFTDDLSESASSLSGGRAAPR